MTESKKDEALEAQQRVLDQVCKRVGTAEVARRIGRAGNEAAVRRWKRGEHPIRLDNLRLFADLLTAEEMLDIAGWPLGDHKAALGAFELAFGVLTRAVATTKGLPEAEVERRMGYGPDRFLQELFRHWCATVDLDAKGYKRTEVFASVDLEFADIAMPPLTDIIKAQAPADSLDEAKVEAIAEALKRRERGE